MPVKRPDTAVKFITGINCSRGGRTANPWRGKVGNGLSCSVTIVVNANHGPVVNPFHRLEVNYSAVCPLLLEVDEPVLPARGCHPGTLVRAINWSLAPVHHHPVLPGTEYLLCPERKLPAVCDSAGRGKNVIVSVPFVKLRPLNRRIVIMAVKDHHRITGDTGTVRLHPDDHQHTFDTGPGPSKCVSQVSAPVIIPQRCGINQAISLHNHHWQAPRSPGTRSFYHVNTVVRIRVKDIELTVPFPDARGPYSTPVPDRGIVFFGQQPVKGITSELPVDKIFGVKYRQARNAVE